MSKFVSRWRSILTACALVAGATVTTTAGIATALASPSQPDFGSSVHIFNPSMPQSQIQAAVDLVASRQVSNQFGTQRDALLFEPGTYGSSANPLNCQKQISTTARPLAVAGPRSWVTKVEVRGPRSLPIAGRISSELR